MTHIIAISGSLRARSYNTALLQACAGLLPEGATLELVPLHEVPLYNGDFDSDEDRPAAVETLKAKIAAADAVLLATPEYNYAESGVLKNALDWASRPAGGSPLTGKPVGMMGASPGGSGAMRAQESLKLTVVACQGLLFPHFGVAVGAAHEKFDGDLKLTDEGTRAFVKAYLEGFVAWADRMNG